MGPKIVLTMGEEEELVNYTFDAPLGPSHDSYTTQK